MTMTVVFRFIQMFRQLLLTPPLIAILRVLTSSTSQEKIYACILKNITRKYIKDIPK